MRKLALVPLVGLVALLALLALLWANLGPNGPGGVSADQPRVITINDRFSDVARAEPAFGGMFYDEQGNLTVYLLDTGKREHARAAIAAVFGVKRIPKDGIRVLPARYSFADLRAWQDQSLSLFAIPGVLSSYINHKANMLEVGVQDLRLSDEVHHALQNLGIPQEAVHIKQTEPIVLQVQETLRNKVRPVKGGLEIQRRINPTLASVCTLGVNALRAGKEGFVTASHCSATPAAVDTGDGAVFYQKENGPFLDGDKIGHETVDPPPFACPPPDEGQQCRFSDVNFSEYDIAPAQYRVGFIEKTQGLNAPQIPESKNIAGNFQITGTGDALQEQVVNKVGRSSGWTNGTVTAVCATERFGVYIKLCQNEASYQSAAGDSGSPVFQIAAPGSDSVTLVGIHWGGKVFAGLCPADCTDEGDRLTTTGVFTPFDITDGVLGPLTVTAPTGVGGVAEPPDVADSALGTAASCHGSSSPNALVITVAAALVVVAVGGWYVRRRSLR